MTSTFLARSDIKQREEEVRNARLEDRARLVEESRKSYEDRVRKEEDEIAAREQEVSCFSVDTRRAACVGVVAELPSACVRTGIGLRSLDFDRSSVARC